jgi:hypothetical protein
VLPHIEPIIVDRKNNLNQIKLFYRYEDSQFFQPKLPEGTKLNIAILKLLGQPQLRLISFPQLFLTSRWPQRSDFDGLTN